MTSSAASPSTPRNAALSLRSAARADREAIERILLSNRPVFSDAECHTAVEMLDESFEKTDDANPYQFLVVERDGEVAGYACFGTIPLTKGSYDLYWIAVDRSRHGGGVGQFLLAGVEREVARQGGRLVVVETSSRTDYDPTRRFYERAGYATAAWIKDFYKPGDDKVLYVKYVSAPSGA